VAQTLRTHLSSSAEFIERVQRQQQVGYQIIYLEVEGSIKALAGFRISECLAWGKFLYVDDLVTLAAERSQGYGAQLIEWLVDYARQQQCHTFELDSGVHRFAAHRFYFQQRLVITSYHFSRSL
jgi:GNAT superfamily N-acetyltransferase